MEAISPGIAGNERYSFNAPEILDAHVISPIIRERFPQLKDRVPAPEEGVGSAAHPGTVRMDISKFEKVFGKRGWKSAKESALDTAADILAYDGRNK